jgi:hypothetical protein
MAPLLIDHGCRSSRRFALLRQAAFSSKVVHLPVVEEWKVVGGKLLWWSDGSLLRWWGRGTVELLLLLLLLLRLLLLELPRLKLWALAPILLLEVGDHLCPLLKLGIQCLHVVLKVDDCVGTDIHLLTGDVKQHTSVVPSMLGVTKVTINLL